MTGTEKAFAFIMFSVVILAVIFVARVLMERFWTKPLREPRLFSEEFNAWKEQKKNMETWHPESDLFSEHLLVTYIRETGFSPFMGDCYCQEAKKFLIEQGWKPEHIHEI